jgi:hypothetical protein
MAMLVCRVLRPVINNDGPATAPATSDRHLAVLRHPPIAAMVSSTVQNTPAYVPTNKP